MELVEKYPESEFFVEANMNIGRYFFDHPKIQNGQGYKLAEEAYRKVLFYRDHPEFVQALYHLGWCYYMQDRYEEAIAVFKYLIEEVELDFDPSKIEEKQVVNPLLRGEAIDYIAISFDEQGKIEDAIKFLQLIGNADYAAIVLKRIGELREEDLDFEGAIKIYRRLQKEYPFAMLTPEASASLIKILDTKKERADTAMLERENFFELYSKGGEWQKNVNKKDTMLIHRVDSMSISIELFVADAFYRKAEEKKSPEDYQQAVDNYKKLVDKYPDIPRAADARWNLAVILDTKLNQKAQAYDQYLQFSKMLKSDSTRREQGAINAIGIAQSMLPPDSLVEKGTLDFASTKVVEAVTNYVQLFPSGKSYTDELLKMGQVYFNRHLFSKAVEVFTKIVNRGVLDKNYYEAYMLMGQCHFGDENWPNAITAFSRVWKDSKDASQKSSAYKLSCNRSSLTQKIFSSRAISKRRGKHSVQLMINIPEANSAMSRCTIPPKHLRKKNCGFVRATVITIYLSDIPSQNWPLMLCFMLPVTLKKPTSMLRPLKLTRSWLKNTPRLKMPKTLFSI